MNRRARMPICLGTLFLVLTGSAHAQSGLRLDFANGPAPGPETEVIQTEAQLPPPAPAPMPPAPIAPIQSQPPVQPQVPMQAPTVMNWYQPPQIQQQQQQQMPQQQEFTDSSNRNFCMPPANQCCCDHGGCFVQAGVYFLQPMAFSSKFNALTINTENLSGATISSQGVNFDYNFTAAPQIILGYSFCDGLAFRARYWRFDETSNSSYTAPGTDGGGNFTILLGAGGPLQAPFAAVPGGNTLFSSDHLEVDVLDLELTQEVCFCRCSLTYFGGVRLARIRQAYNAHASIAVDDEDTITEDLNSSDTIRGIGPTVGYEFRRPLCCGFSFYNSTRAAILFGHENISGSTSGTDLGLAPNFFQISDSRRDFVPMGELEVGFEWNGECHHYHLMAQATGVGMAYGDLGFGGFNLRFGVQY